MAPSPLEVAVRAAVAGNLRPLKTVENHGPAAREGHQWQIGRTMLHFAAKAGLLDLCRFLIEELGFDANFPSARGETPILVTTEAEGDETAEIVPVLRYLLAHGGDPAAPDDKGYTPLHNAAEFGHHEAVRLLLSKGAPVDPINQRGTPLHLAAAMDHDQVVKILLEHGADPNRVANHVLSPLTMACCGHSLKCMKLLIKAGADVNLKSPSGRSVLSQAVDDGITDIVKFLLEAGADPNIDDGDGKIPIMIAAAREQCELVKILLPRTKPLPSVPDWSVDGIIRTMKYPQSEPQAAMPPSPFEITIQAAVDGNLQLLMGHHDAVRLLLSKGVPVDPLNRRGTPLHLAAAKDRDQAVKILLEHGADPNRVGNRVLSPLAMACFGHSLKCMKLLVEAGADVNLKGPSGQPVLFNAVDGLTDIVKFLLEAGADPNIHDGDGKFPVMLAAARGQRELVEILLPRTKLIPCMPDWSVDGIIRTMKYLQFEPQGSVSEQIADAKSQGKEAFAKGDYVAAVYSFTLAIELDPLDATLFANRSLCWQRLGEGDLALSDAQKCKALRPRWVKAWYREGTALVLLKIYKKAVEVFEEALKLDPTNDEIKKALREAKRSSARAR